MTPEEIKAILERKGWSYQQMADHLRCRKATVSDWVNGKKKVGNAYAQLLKQL